jgi:hypothetical protein
MARLFLALSASALLVTGCVPVTEGAGDINKAKPNKNLIGSWLDQEREPRTWVVDRPDVKGNPEGVMRVRIVEKNEKLESQKSKDALWFFTATIGKETYVNALVSDTDPDLSQEGGFKKWSEDPKRGYYAGHIKIEKDRVTIDPGDEMVLDGLMREAKFSKVGKSSVYQTTPGWLTAYLEKNGPKRLFASDKKSRTVLTRVKD